MSKVKLLGLSITINFTKDKKNISKLGDYDVPFCEQQYMHGSCYIYLYKFESFGQLVTPPPSPFPPSPLPLPPPKLPQIYTFTQL